jgi:hypothetical protein
MPLDAIDCLQSATDPVSRADAYRAMLRVLEYYFHIDADYPVGGILGQLVPGVWADGQPGDPAAWSLWLNALDGKPLDGTFGA